MSAAINTARGQRRSGVTGRRGQTKTALDFGRERLRFTLRREQRRLTALNIDPYVEHVDWARDNQVRTGELNFYRPLTGLQAGAIAEGDRVLCEVDLHGTGQWRRLWYMTVDTPQHQIVQGTLSMALKAGLKTAQESKAAFSLKGKDARQITLEVARRFHIQVGPLPEAHHKIDKLVRKSASPVDVVTAAWAAERTATGRRFDVDLSRGRIDVTELREPFYMLLLGPAIIDAAVQQTLRSMASAVIVTSTRRVGGRRQKLRVKVVDEARVNRHGYIVRHVNHPNLASAAAARRWGLRWLARQAKPTEDITFTHPGLPFLDKGDALRLTLADADLNNLLCFVKSANHQCSAGSYTMDVTVGLSDPWVDVKAERVKKMKANAARARKRAGATATTAPKTAKAARRS